MKFTKIIASLAIAGLVLVSCKKEEDKSLQVVNAEKTAPKEHKPIAAENLQTASFTIEGMTCAMGCAKTIEEKLADMDGVQNAKVDFETKMATVNFDLDKLKSEDLVKAAESCADGKTYKVSDVKLGNKA